MEQGTLTIYSASAGSGKTYRLTAIYLASIFRSRYNYRRILAVTFTNKATAEMKSRIVENLYKLASGDHSGYLEELVTVTGKSENWIRNEAKEILNAILHDFSRFSVSTIDSFFQRVLRNFTREAGLHTGFGIELDYSSVLSQAVDEVIASAKDDAQVRNWLISYAKSNIEEGKSWNLKESIIKLSEELFKEKFRLLSSDERSKIENKQFLHDYIEKIKSLSSSFKKQLKEYGKDADSFFSKYNLSDDMFYRKGLGIPGFVKSLLSGTIKRPNSYVYEILSDPPRWSTGTIDPTLQLALSNGLENTIKGALDYFEKNYIAYKSAEKILQNIYDLGILSDVLMNIHQITTSDNMFLLSDAAEVINLIIKGDQSPFIYEKMGNRYENFMIDEFQDTSRIQWSNFKPLVDNSMAEGHDNLVVGDIKQSIYRWRNSDWRIMGQDLAENVDGERIFSKVLNTNWRSCKNIIRFNNRLFTVIPDIVDNILSDDSLPVSFRSIYAGAIQKSAGEDDAGYVRIEFPECESETEWQAIVLERLPDLIKSVQDNGFKASDIGIIVRTGKEGSLVLNRLIDYNSENNLQGESIYNFRAVSNDSLLLSNSPAVNFIISTITKILNPDDQINNAAMLKYYLLATGKNDIDSIDLHRDKLDDLFRKYFPERYKEFLDRMRVTPLFEVTEGIIGFFSLGDYQCNVPFLNTFQDHVLNFSGTKNSGMMSFLDWWNDSGMRKAVVLPDNQDSMRIMTIHKSKGLEFRIVILPFLSWDLDHGNSRQPQLWVKPSSEPFHDLGIVPVRYSKDLLETIFADDYKEEKYSVYLDNINLLYVAFTRAKDALFGYAFSNPKQENSISGILKKALSLQTGSVGQGEIDLAEFFNADEGIFEYGYLHAVAKSQETQSDHVHSGYAVSNTLGSLKLKLHGENYFSSEGEEVRKKLNYGKMMHEIFEGITSYLDVSASVRKMVLDGKLTENESIMIEQRVNEMMKTPEVADWFSPDNKVLNETGILLPSGITRRPDRVIIKDDKSIIVDFKFGEENKHHIEQITQYRDLLKEMGYNNTEAYIWYVDKGKIVTV